MYIRPYRFIDSEAASNASNLNIQIKTLGNT